jgi:hypothetical protein
MSGQVFEILNEGGAVINRIVACPAFVEQSYPGRWRQVAAPLGPAAPPVVPTKVTRAQGKAALYKAGLLAQVEAFVEAMPEGDDKAFARFALSDCNNWERGSQFLNAAAQQLGLTQERLDELFRAAAQIEL